MMYLRSVFFYGLFMDVDILRAKGVAPSRVRTAAAPGFALRLGARATLVPDASATSYGVVMDITPDELDRLYAEASVSAYKPEAMLVRVDDGSWIAALCMTLPTPPAPHESNPEYARKLRALAERLELPAGYVESIR